MARQGRKAQAPRRNPRTVALIALAAVAVITVAAMLVLRDGDDSGNGGADEAEVFGGARTLTPVDDFSHIHGLAVAVDDPSVLYAATHYGLLRGSAGNWSYVGEVRDDLMGFTAHPTNGSILWVSGHPESGGNMGVRKSTDGGFTWRFIGGKGIDFHLMAASPAHAEHLWGYYAGSLHRSTDGGVSWTRLTGSPPATALAPHPSDTEKLYVGTAQQGVVVTEDGGTTWKPFKPGGATAIAVARDASVHYVALPDGVDKSTDGGASWTRTSLTMPEGDQVRYLALHPTDPDTLYAATLRTGIHRTTDGGSTWEVVKAPSA